MLDENRVILSIIIPTYNRPEKLQKSIHSIKSSSPEKVEVIVCDDNSSPESQKQSNLIINEAKNELPFNIVFLQNYKGKGVSGARNSAIEKSSGEWILFLDDDDELTENYIDIILDEIQFKKVDFIWSDLFFRYSKDSLAKRRFIIPDQTNNLERLYREVISLGISYGVCLKKSKFLECGGFNESFQVGEDTELILNLMKHNCIFYHLDVFGVIKNEDNPDMLSKNLGKYLNDQIIPRLLDSYLNELSNHLILYSDLLKRGNEIYLSQKKYIKNILFTIRYFIKSRKVVQLYKLYKH